MLGRLILILLQIVLGWLGTNALKGFVKFNQFELFIFAVLAAIVVYLIGVIAAQVLKDVGAPSGHTLSWSLTFALIAAALWTWGPSLPLLKEVPWGKIPDLYAVLGAAILGYHIKK